MNTPKRRLHSIEPNEVSLVDIPANQHPFLLTKADQGPSMSGTPETEVSWPTDMASDVVAKAQGDPGTSDASAPTSTSAPLPTQPTDAAPTTPSTSAAPPPPTDPPPAPPPATTAVTAPPVSPASPSTSEQTTAPAPTAPSTESTEATSEMSADTGDALTKLLGDLGTAFQGHSGQGSVATTKAILAVLDQGRAQIAKGLEGEAEAKAEAAIAGANAAVAAVTTTPADTPTPEPTTAPPTSTPATSVTPPSTEPTPEPTSAPEMVAKMNGSGLLADALQAAITSFTHVLTGTASQPLTAAAPTDDAPQDASSPTTTPPSADTPTTKATQGWDPATLSAVVAQSVSQTLAQHPGFVTKAGPPAPITPAPASAEQLATIKAQLAATQAQVQQLTAQTRKFSHLTAPPNSAPADASVEASGDDACWPIDMADA